MSNREPTEREIEDFARTHLRIRSRVVEASGPHIVADCHRCMKKSRLYLNTGNGLWDCKTGECGAKGNLWTLANDLGVRIRQPSTVKSAVSVLTNTIQRQARKRKRTSNAKGFTLDRVDAACRRVFDDDNEKGKRLRDYLHGRGFDDDTIRHFRLGSGVIKDNEGVEDALLIPYVVDDKVPLIKMRNLAVDKAKRKFRRTGGSDSILFNARAIDGRDQIVLVEAELDAISLWQAGIVNVIATSLGAKKTLPEEWVEMLNGVTDIVLWFDDDSAGDEAIAGLLPQLGSYRCRIASIPEDLSKIGISSTDKKPNDANDLLQMGVDAAGFRHIVDGAVELDDGSIVRMAHYFDAVSSEINLGDDYLGLTFNYGGLSDLLKGLRPELTVVTGHTGHGKSTWITDLVCEINKQTGAPILLTSFENGPESLARKLFQREFGRPISSLKTDLDRELAIDSLRAVSNVEGVFIVDRYGEMEMDQLVDSVTFAAKRYGVKAVVLDHLHFFLPENNFTDERKAIDKCVRRLVKLCRDEDVHIFLVAHPRGNIDESSIPGGGSLKGSSAIKQDADNGISVYRSRPSAFETTTKKVSLKDENGKRIKIELGPTDTLIKVWKARHDEATEGAALFKFNRGSLKYEPAGEAKSPPVDAYDPRTGSADEYTYDEEDPFDGF